MIAADDDLWVIEMDIVSTPFVLNFAGAYLDTRPDFPDDVSTGAEVFSFHGEA